jgi:MFS family permease
MKGETQANYITSAGDVERGLKLDEKSTDAGIRNERSVLSLQTSPILSLSHRSQNISDTRKSFFYRIFLPSPNGTSDTPPPDGGLRAWTIVLMSHLAGFNTFGFLNAYGVLQSYYVSSLSLPPSTISWIGSLQAFLLLFVSFLSGRLTDAGYFQHLLVAGTLVNLIGFISLSFSTQYYQILLSQGVCIGLGGGMVFCPSMSIVGTYFDKKRSMALAVVAIGNSIGGLVFAAILQNCIPRYGFGWAMRICGIVAMCGLVPACLLMKERGIKRVSQAPSYWCTCAASLEADCVFLLFSMTFSSLLQFLISPDPRSSNRMESFP